MRSCRDQPFGVDHECTDELSPLHLSVARQKKGHLIALVMQAAPGCRAHVRSSSSVTTIKGVM